VRKSLTSCGTIASPGHSWRHLILRP